MAEEVAAFKKTFKDSNDKELRQVVDLGDGKIQIQFLTTEISSSNSVEVRNSIASLIEDNLENQVKAKVKEDFIVSQIEPAYVPVIKSKPNRTLIVIFGTFVGFLIGSIVVLLRFFYSGSSQK